MGQLSQYSKKIIANVLFELVPKKLGGLICALGGNHRNKRKPVEKRAAKKSHSVIKEAAIINRSHKAISRKRQLPAAASAQRKLTRRLCNPKFAPAYFLPARSSTPTAPAADIICRYAGQQAPLRVKFSRTDSYKDRRNVMNRRIILKVAALCCLLLLQTSCSRVAITGRKQLNIVPDSMMNSMALQSYNEFLTVHQAQRQCSANGNGQKRRDKDSKGRGEVLRRA